MALQLNQENLTIEQKRTIITDLNLNQIVTIDNNGTVTLNQIVISTSPSDDGDGRPAGTIHIQIV